MSLSGRRDSRESEQASKKRWIRSNLKTACRKAKRGTPSNFEHGQLRITTHPAVGQLGVIVYTGDDRDLATFAASLLQEWDWSTKGAEQEYGIHYAAGI
jgi:hypothetical protein